MVWYVRYRPKGTVVYNTAPGVTTPVFSVSPVISGATTLGATLSATTGLASGSPSYSLQWRRNGTPIPGATGSNYVIQAADQGASISVASTATIGLVSATLVSSGLAIPPASVPAPVFSVAPVITGTPTEGQTLSATNGTASNSPTYALQWKRNGGSIIGATGSTYLLTSADVGTVITVTSTATNAGGSVSSTSVATATIAAAGVPTFPTTTDTSLPVPSLTLVSVNADGSSPVFDIGNLADASVPAGDVLWIEQRNKAGALVARFYNAIDDAEATAEAASFGLSAITAGTYRYSAFLARGTSVSTGSATVIAGPDDVEPTLSAPTVTSITSSAATVGATTDEGNGTLYVVLTTANSAPSAVQVENGQTSTGSAAAKAGNVTVTAAGAQTISLTGLTGSTTYYRWLMHKDAAGNRSLVLAGGSFATNAVSTQTLLWSATDKNANIGRSGDGKTATLTAGDGSAPYGIRSAIAIDLTKKLYIELPVNARTGTMCVGLVNGSSSLSTYMGDENGYVVFLETNGNAGFRGNLALDGGASSTGGTGPAPYTLCLAIDGPNKKFAAKILGQQWMPGANTTLNESIMKSFSFLTGTLYLGMSSDRSGDAVTIRSVAGDMLGVIPTGYQAVDA